MIACEAHTCHSYRVLSSINRILPCPRRPNARMTLMSHWPSTSNLNIADPTSSRFAKMRVQGRSRGRSRQCPPNTPITFSSNAKANEVDAAGVSTEAFSCPHRKPFDRQTPSIGRSTTGSLAVCTQCGPGPSIFIQSFNRRSGIKWHSLASFQHHTTTTTTV